MCRSRDGTAGRWAALALLAACFALLAPGVARATSSSAYVTSPGSSNVFQYDVGAGGLFAAKAPAMVAAGTGARELAVSPDGKSLYVANFNGNSVSQYDVGAGGLLAAKSPATVAITTPWGVAVSPDGRSVYVANLDGDSVAQYDVGAGGTLTAKTPATVAAGTGGPRGVAVSPDGHSVYVANGGGITPGNSVSQYDVGAGGALTAKTPATVLAGMSPFELAVSPDGKSVYVTNRGSNSAYQYDVGAGGLLAAKSPATVPTGATPEGVAVSPDGRSVYVTNFNDSNVSQYDVGAGGLLAAKTPATVSVGGKPNRVSVSPDGKSAYVTSDSSGVSQYDVGAGGLLAAKTPATVPAGGGPFGVALLPDQGPVAAFGASAAAVGSPSQFNASGSTDTDGAVARYDWDFGDGATLPNGGPTPAYTYAAAGTYTARLTVTDDGGCSTALIFTGQTAFCNPGPAATSRPVTIAPLAVPAPALSRLTLSPAVFRAAPSGLATLAARAAAAKQKKRKTGTLISYRDSQAARTTFTVLRSQQGVRQGKRCLKAPKHPKPKAKRCVRLVSLGTFTHTDRAGKNRLRFSGRLRAKKLKPGRYQLRAIARNSAGKTSRPATKSFHIKR